MSGTPHTSEGNHSYVIDGRKYETLMVKLYNKLNAKYKVSDITISVSLGFTVFMTGFILSFFDFNNFHFIYISSLPIYLGVFGIMWVSASMVWGTKKYVKVLNNARIYFNISDAEYLETTEKWLKPMVDDKRALFYSFIFIIFTYFVVFIVYHYNISFLMLFPPEWYLPPTFYKILILDIYATIIVFLMVTSGRLLILNILLMNDLGKKPVYYYPNLTKKLKPLCDFNLIAAITWMVGNALVLKLIDNNWGLITFCFELLLAAIGISMFFLPQLSLHKTLKKSRENMISIIDGICEYQYKSIYEDPDAVKNRADILRELITLDKAYNIVESPPKTWIYDMPSLIKLFGTALILIYPVIVDFILNKIISIPCT